MSDELILRGNGGPSVPLAVRFEQWCMPEPMSGCRLWFGAVNRLGYGIIGNGRRGLLLAHRAAWLLAYGSIPEGICVLHSCDNPACVEVRHLFLGTNKDNSADMVRKNRGPKSKRGLPYGVATEKNGTFRSRAFIDGSRRYLGAFATAEEAATVVLRAKAAAR